jgi:3-oxoacyl-[acyl-carrier protein] reductase
MSVINLSGKTALVTGAGAGIGRAVIEAFACSGARTAVVEIDSKRAAAVEMALREMGVEPLVTVADVCDADAINKVIGDIEARFGHLDILVNNVGDFLRLSKPFEKMSDSEIETLYAVNLKSVFVPTRAAIPLIRKGGGGGSIISISSIEAFRGCPMNAVYSTFKHAITGFTRSLALELGPDSVRVNAIAPETTETRQVPVHAMVAPEHRDHISRWIPLGRFGEPVDLAGAALFLASDLSSWITGTTIHVDGGALAAGGWYRDPNDYWTNVPVMTGNGFNFGTTRAGAGSG